MPRATCGLEERADGSGTARSTPGKVFDLTLPLDDAADDYRAMDERAYGAPAFVRFTM